MNETKLSSRIRSCVRLLIFSIWSILIPVYLLAARLLNGKYSENIPMQFHRGCCRILPIAVTTEGELSHHRPTLYVCNHISYLDIFILGGLVPGCFIAKSEVAGWPILGQLARLQNTLFFERKGSRAHSQIKVMAKQLSEQGNLILFPEGTSTDGRHVEPFKSSLFHSAEVAEDVSIQPISIVYTTHREQPMHQAVRDYFAWYSDMPFASHFFKMAGMGQVQTKLVFHSPVRLADFESRKACADHCQAVIAASMVQELESAGVEIANDDSGYVSKSAPKSAVSSP